MSIKIYKDAAVGLVYFEGSRLRPQPANQLSVSLHPTLTDRLVIKRLDQFRADGVTPRTKFAKLLYTRIRDANGNAFATVNDALDIPTSYLCFICGYNERRVSRHLDTNHQHARHFYKRFGIRRGGLLQDNGSGNTQRRNI